MASLKFLYNYMHPLTLFTQSIVECEVVAFAGVPTGLHW